MKLPDSGDAWLLNEMITLYLPVMEDREAEGLSLCVGPKVSFKAKGVNSWDECFDGVERRARDWCILGHMTSSPCQHSVDC